MAGHPTVFQASVIPVWEHTVVYVPNADGVHAIVPEGLDARDVARVAIATVLGIDPADIVVEIGVRPDASVAVMDPMEAGRRA